MAPVIHPQPANAKVLAIRAAGIAVIGFVLLAVGLVVDPERASISYLMAYAFAFTIVVGALILLLISYAANARWMAVVRRPIELAILPLPALAVLFVPVVLAFGWLYPWHTPPAGIPHHVSEVLHHRAGFYNTAAVVIRAILYFGVLLTAALLLRRWSVRRDAVEDDHVVQLDPVAALGRERGFASAMLPAVGLAFTFAMIDWVMTLEPVWYSSMFPVYLFAGGFLAAIGLVTMLAARVRSAGLDAITPNHFHALGRLLFAFTVFWTYTAFFQAMLIRIADKPEELGFFMQRTTGAWEPFVYILVLGHFALPFLILLRRPIKFRPRAMAFVGGWLVVMHLVDLYWIVVPSHVHGGFVLHWLDLAALAAVGGTAVAVAAIRQHGVPLLASRDPFFADGVAYRSPL